MAADSGLKKVSFIPLWVDQAQFAGYMVAQEKGFYRDAGLDVDMLRGGPDAPPFAAIKKGKATFGVGWLSIGLAQRAMGLKVVNLAQIVQKSALMLIARKDGRIASVRDFGGKRVGLWPGLLGLQPAICFEKHGLTVDRVPNYTSVSLFLERGVDAMSAMWYNEYHSILNSGFDPDELSVFLLSDCIADFPEDGLYCLEETLLADPQACSAFVQASLKGWLYAFDHKDEALSIVMRYADAANTKTNRAHQKWMLERMEDLITPNRDRTVLGKLVRDKYEAVAKAMEDFGAIKLAPQFDEFYRGPR
jgi:NitT/TauT family transport system substrate-binding protein